MQQDSQQSYWDKVSKNKVFTTSLNINLVKHLIDPNSYVVDFGCGYGRTLNELWGMGYKNTMGYDFSREMIKRGQNEYPYLNLKVLENNTLPCDNGSVDMIILFALLTCIVDNSAQISLMQEAIRVLKPGGIIYINDFLLNTDQRNINRYQSFADKYKNYGVFELPEGAVLRHHSEKWIQQLTQEFQKEAMEKITFRTMNGHQSNGFVFVGRKPF